MSRSVPSSSLLRSFPRAVRGQLLAEGVLPLNAPILVAFSGGADSTALALSLHRLGLPFMLAHLNHGLRPEAAAESAPEGPVRTFAAQLGVACHIEHEDVAAMAASRGLGLEEAGRLARYAFLERTRAAQGCAWIALGHQADDLIEDMLLRLVRGTGWPALAGMRACDPSRHLVRPLLQIPRADIEAFLNAAGQSWLHDASNDTNAFRRNRLRHGVLPTLLDENPSFHQAALALWAQAREDERFWEAFLAPTLACVCQTQAGLALPEAALRPLPRAARLRLYAELLRRMARRFGSGQARASTLFNLDRALLRQERPKRFQFPGGVVACLADGRLELTSPPAPAGTQNASEP
ncbi:MAG TPA: tRNA lysidine(34) synthetase TilS [Candidatus Avidesulfovibrio excrementigallinarum]|nr:tRNA lysidine(34) synthetase TilS [Candidatus Avidesulfovibrio excrementigallinarum]